MRQCIFSESIETVMQLPPVEELQEIIADPKKKRSLRTVQLTLSNLRRLRERGIKDII